MWTGEGASCAPVATVFVGDVGADVALASDLSTTGEDASFSTASQSSSFRRPSGSEMLLTRDNDRAYDRVSTVEARTNEANS